MSWSNLGKDSGENWWVRLFVLRVFKGTGLLLPTVASIPIHPPNKGLGPKMLQLMQFSPIYKEFPGLHRWDKINCAE